MDVPILDFSLSREGVESNKQQAFHDQFIGALSHFGFVKLVNHGVDESLIREAFDWNKRYFALPDEVKAKAVDQGPVAYRGWIRPGQENAGKVTGFGDGKKAPKAIKPDVKECFDIGSASDSATTAVWLDNSKLPGFRAFFEDFYLRLVALNMEILRALARGLGIDPERFVELCNGTASSLRLNHYPASDVSTLQNDGVGGLEIEDQEHTGVFTAVPNVQGPEIIINIGDTMQRWTNDKLRSACHRVRLPPELMNAENGQVEARYSMAMFGKANRNVSVATLPEFKVPGLPEKYDDITAWQYQKKKTEALYV